jgi:hypothetical protein
LLAAARGEEESGSEGDCADRDVLKCCHNIKK